MAQHVATLEALPRWGHQVLTMEGDTAAYSGHLKDARELSRRAMDSAQRGGEKDAPALYSGTAGLREAWFGNTDEARRRSTLALKLSTGRDLQYFIALAFAYARDDARAKALADDLDKRFPEDTIVQFNYLPSVRGKLALNKGDASGAIESLGAAAPYELGATRTTDLDWTAMFPVFVRGEAYLAARKGSQAAAEFQKILDHRGLVLNQPIGALAHLGLGRAYVLQATSPRPRRPIRISLRYGRTRTRIFLSCKRRKRSTRSCSSEEDSASNAIRGSSESFDKAGYIFVFQDVRGRPDLDGWSGKGMATIHDEMGHFAAGHNQ
ncbi:MAG TPA: hypothetical protein VK638_48535 [Edaphobacter sp.]|nr:hypothetical protein [Edaphobacter sp.]